MDFYGTLGPACCEENILYEMFEAGMTGMRLNLSHKSLADCEEWMEQMRRAAKRAGKEAKLLVDLQGPELRVGTYVQPLSLEAGKEYPLALFMLPDAVVPYLREGQQILLDDGKLLGEICGADQREEGSRIHILRGGILQSRKSIAFPGLTVPSPTLTQADLENLAQATAYGVTGVMLPFVRNAQDLQILRQALAQAGADQVRIYAKLENQEGVRMLEELLPFADEIVIARGDLGNSMELWHLPAVQKQIAQSCRKAGTPFMVVTQMLASMEHAAVPTRAEVSDIFNAVLDGAASVMVTGETAVGEYPVETMRYLVNTGNEALEFLQKL